MLEKHEADVIGTQETSNLIYLFLQEHCPEYVLAGDGRDHNRQGERCCIMINNDTYRLLNTETVWLNGNFKLAGDKDEYEGVPRICTMALIQNKAALAKVRIFNCHLAYRAQDVILRNGENLMRYIDSFADDQFPFVLTGDFNSPIDQPLHAPFLKRFKEAYTSLNQVRPNSFHGFGDPLGINAIDFIYTNTLTFQSVMTDTEKFEGLYPSDHYPVIAELT